MTTKHHTAKQRESRTSWHPIVNLIRTEWRYLGSRKSLFLLSMALFTIAFCINLLTPYMIGTVFNSIQDVIATPGELRSLLLRMSLLILLNVLFGLFYQTSRCLEQGNGFWTRRNFVNEKIGIILKLPIGWHKDHHSGDTIDKINRASGALEEFCGQKTYEVVGSLIAFVGSISVLFAIDATIGVFTLLASSLMLFIVSRVDQYLTTKYLELNTYNNAYSATLFDSISNIITVITLRLKDTVAQEIDQKQRACYPTLRSSFIVNEIKWAFGGFAIRTMIVLCLLYRAYTEYYATGAIQIGTLYMLYGYVGNVGEVFFTFALLYDTIMKTHAKLVGAYPIDDAYAECQEIETSPLPPNWREIALRDVSFTYNLDGTRKHIDHIDFSFKRHQKIALIGESGSGKSTLLSLLRGLYGVEEGELYCDGQCVKDGVLVLKETTMLLPQEPEIFNNTVRYNITMDLPYDLVAFQQVMTMAQLESVIARLPKQLDSLVMEKGVSLSGGEKQRLALARGLLAAQKSEIVLLDEPTSSIDSVTEAKIYQQILHHFRDKTIICAMHRLHLLEAFDDIYLLSNGKIVGHCPLDELKQHPQYQQMWRHYTQHAHDQQHGTGT